MRYTASARSSGGKMTATRLEHLSDAQLKRAVVSALELRAKMLEKVGGGYPNAPFIEAARRWSKNVVK